MAMMKRRKSGGINYDMYKEQKKYFLQAADWGLVEMVQLSETGDDQEDEDEEEEEEEAEIREMFSVFFTKMAETNQADLDVEDERNDETVDDNVKNLLNQINQHHYIVIKIDKRRKKILFLPQKSKRQ